MISKVPFILLGISLDDFFTLDREWTLLNFLLYRQKYSDFCADKHEEYSRYTRSLASIFSYEEQSPEMIKLASDALNLLQVRYYFLVFCCQWTGLKGQ